MGAALPCSSSAPFTTSSDGWREGGRRGGGDVQLQVATQCSAVVQVAGLCRAAQEDPLFVAAKGTCYIQSISVHPFTGILKISKSKR